MITTFHIIIDIFIVAKISCPMLHKVRELKKPVKLYAALETSLLVINVKNITLGIR